MVASSARVGLSGAAQVAVIGISGRVNIRAEPSVLSPVIGHARAATRLDTDGCLLRLERLWCGVRWARGAGQRGWVAAEYLLPVEDAAFPGNCDGATGGGACSAPTERTDDLSDIAIDVGVPYLPSYHPYGQRHERPPHRRSGQSR